MTKREVIEWRRNKVQELLIKGYNQTRVAKEVQVSNRVISNDVYHLKLQAKESMKDQLEQRLPPEFTHCMLVLKFGRRFIGIEYFDSASRRLTQFAP